MENKQSLRARVIVCDGEIKPCEQFPKMRHCQLYSKRIINLNYTKTLEESIKINGVKRQDRRMEVLKELADE